MRRNSSLGLLAAAALMGGAAYGQSKPNYTGTWELIRIERSDGMNLPAGKTFKETQVWLHQEPKLSIKIMTWDQKVGYSSVDLTYDTKGTAGLVGYLVHSDGTKEPVNGSAHWDGDRLVHEEEIPNARNGAPRRIIRTSRLEDGGQKMVFDQVYWLAGEDESRKAQWLYIKKTGTP